MGLITKITTNKWHRSNKDYYINKGYEFTKIGDKFEVKVEDLTKGSVSLVDVQCNGCDETLINIIWQNYLKFVKEDGKYYCQKCATNGYKKWNSFYEWCYNNLSKNEADNIILRWDYDLNIDKNGKRLTPNNISFASHGENKKGYWFKCLDHPEHKSEQKDIDSFTHGQNGSMNCNQCNTIAITHPYLIKYFINKNDTNKYSIGTHKQVLMRCPDCGYEKEKRIREVAIRGFCCPRCSDKKSYPEKFMFALLEQLNINFKNQLSKKTFKWCKDYLYDFYLEDLNCITETHGLQHYQESGKRWKISFDENQENDKNKEKLAKDNGVKYYIILDCRYSDMEWIKNNILESKLPQLLNFKEENIDWLKCHEYALSSIVKKICELWRSGIRSVTKISEHIKINNNSIRNYLKQGAELGWCDYKLKQ